MIENLHGVDPVLGGGEILPRVRRMKCHLSAVSAVEPVPGRTAVADEGPVVLHATAADEREARMTCDCGELGSADAVAALAPLRCRSMDNSWNLKVPPASCNPP